MTLSSWSDMREPSMPSQSRRNAQLTCKNIKFESLDCKLDNVCTWLHSHNQMKEFDGIDG